MKRFVLTFSIVAAVVVSPFVRAEEQSLSDEQLNAIVANCTTAQVALRRVQQSDKPVRINRGYQYDSLLKLMTSLNTRAAGNRLDVPDLLTATSQFEEKIKQFTQQYTDYDRALSHVQTMSCRETPTDFYDRLSDLRSDREALHKSVGEMEELLNTYAKSVQLVRMQVEQRSAQP